MSEWNGFDNLDLSDVEADSGVRRLRPGRYVCTISGVDLAKTKDGKGRKVEVLLVDSDGAGVIQDYINVHLPGKEKATEIGRKRLKTLLTHCGHPSPDKPGDLRQIKGAVVGVNVVESEYQDSNGATRIGSEVDGWHPFFNPENAKGLGPATPTGTDSQPSETSEKAQTSSFDDDIPF